MFASVALVAMGVSACSGGAAPVQIEPPSPRGEAAAACRGLVSVLPGRLDDQPRKRIEPRSPFAAAFGDPPVVVRCGVPEPPELRPTSELFTVNGVDWLFVERDDGAYVFTTTGRTAFLEVTVPAEQQPGSTFLVDLAGPVTHAVPKQNSPKTDGGAARR